MTTFIVTSFRYIPNTALEDWAGSRAEVGLHRFENLHSRARLYVLAVCALPSANVLVEEHIVAAARWAFCSAFRFALQIEHLVLEGRAGYTSRLVLKYEAALSVR